MKNVLSFFAVMALFLISGCAMMGNNINEPIITSMPNNSFEISMRGGIMTNRETLQTEWLKVAEQKCADYEIVSRDFALQYEMPTLSGVIKCKKKSKSESSIESQNSSSTPTRIVPPNSTSSPASIEPQKSSTVSESSTPQNSSTSPSSMIVTENKAKLRKKPSTKADVVKSLKKGEEVQVIRQKDGWCLVELAGGETGWCAKGSLAQKN